MLTLPSSVVSLLMELQYRFPLTPTPFHEVASRLGTSVDEVLAALRDLASTGVVKRVGFYVNARALGRKPYLIAVEAPDTAYARKLVEHDARVTHAYVREHPKLNVWLVARLSSLEEAASYAASFARKCGGSLWAIFPSERTLKLSVKYDLVEGVSRSGPYSRLPAGDPPPPESVGFPRHLLHELASLPIRERPYSEIAKALGAPEDRVLAMVRKMLSLGLLLDPGVALDGWRLGFRSNAMAIAEPGPCDCFADQPYTTHVVLRTAYPDSARRLWGSRLCYFMVHATSRKRAMEAVDEVLARCGGGVREVLFSVEDLKPGARR
jgi:DNA-binding Lrp family transcriptional regulator